MATQTNDEPAIKYEPEEMKPEFIVCANDDNFEIAYDPLASIDDAYPILPNKDDKLNLVDVYLPVKIAKQELREDVKSEISPFDEGVIDNDSGSDDFEWNDAPTGSQSVDVNEEITIGNDKTAADEGRFKCAECDKTFKFSSRLKEHSKKHAKPSTLTTFACLVCDKRFRRENNLKLHMDALHPVGDDGQVQSAPAPKQCDICHKEFSHNGYFKTHMKIHGGVRAFPCTVCDKAFVLAQHLKSHMKLVHSDEKSIQCTKCGKLFNHPGNYKKHMRTHSGERPFQCPLCPKSFGQSSNYTAHMRVHTKDRPFKCIECERTFSQAKNLTNHMRTHGSEQSFKCDLCEKTFTRHNHLRLHAKKHQPSKSGETKKVSQVPSDSCKPELCTICGKSLVGGRRSLRMHMKIHENNRPHACLFCDKKFITKNDCTKHTRIHTGEKPFQCELCTKRFRHSASYRIHMRNHSGEKPYRCTHCDKGFSASSDCKKHMKSHENGRLAAVTTTMPSANEETDKKNILYLL